MGVGRLRRALMKLGFGEPVVMEIGEGDIPKPNCPAKSIGDAVVVAVAVAVVRGVGTAGCMATTLG